MIEAHLDKETKGEAKYAAKLTRPSSSDAFMSRINIWIMTCQATGVANAIVTTPFLEDAVYAPLRKGVGWQVVHELFVLYLQKVDRFTKYNLRNVVYSGGEDSMRKEAEANAALYFRARGGKPQHGAFSFAWDCACDASANRKCFSFNLKQAHPADSIDSDGRCKYLHKCDQFVLAEDGTKTQCGGNHPRRDCKNPKKVAGKQSGGGN